jgi:uncharacterized membrane protein YbhN (UPF0104 family)
LMLVVFGIAWYLISRPDLFALLRDVSLVQACWLTALRVLLLAVNGLFLRAFASKFNVDLMFKEWFGLSVITSLGNYITPFSGGMVARAVYLKHRHAFPYAQFATLLASNYLVVFWVVSVVGLVVTLLLSGSLQGAWVAASFFGAVAIAVSILVALPTTRLPWENPVANIINTSLEGWTMVKQDKGLVAKLMVYSLVNLLLNGLSIWVAYWAIGHAISFGAALLTSLLMAFSILVNITPGNLGVQEAVISLSSELLGSGAGLGLVVALLIRAATLVVVFTLGPLFSLLLTRELAHHSEEPVDSSADASGVHAEMNSEVIDDNIEEVRQER